MSRISGSHIVLMLLFMPLAGLAVDPGDSVHSRRWYLPHYVPLQFAGNIGFLSTGIGYTTNSNNYEFGLLYGYVPASVGGNYIHKITAKNIFPVLRYSLPENQMLIPYVGFGISVEVGGNAFFTNPSYFPDGYYDFPKNLRLTAFGGAKLRRLFNDDFTFLRGMELYAEAGTVDVYVWYGFLSEHIKLRQMFSLALGINLLLDH